MKERLVELKNKATERANYYSRISFENLANEFTEFANFLNEVEEVVKDNENLKARVAEYERLAQIRAAEARDEADSEVYD